MPATDPLAQHTHLINRAIAMHLLREGQFSVATTFIAEANQPDLTSHTSHSSALSLNGDSAPAMQRPLHPEHQHNFQLNFAPPIDGWTGSEEDMKGIGSNEGLQQHFAEMYHILHELRTNRNLAPAIAWARLHASVLESRGSNLEFELCRLQFVVLFTEPVHHNEGMELDGSSAAAFRNGQHDADSDDDLTARRLRASAYARQAFPHFGQRYMREIQQLSCGLLYGSNFASSPYASLFANASAWEDVASSFTREFCSLLGLSADSPLYVASTAGAIALPRIRKYAELQARNKVEWTSVGELPVRSSPPSPLMSTCGLTNDIKLQVEIPLPPSYYFHPIFVCPVSREQATDANPPMMMPCGHVILHESLANTSKGARFKCPYCPGESHPREARRVYLA